MCACVKWLKNKWNTIQSGILPSFWSMPSAWSLLACATGSANVTSNSSGPPPEARWSQRHRDHTGESRDEPIEARTRHCGISVHGPWCAYVVNLLVIRVSICLICEFVRTYNVARLRRNQVKYQRIRDVTMTLFHQIRPIHARLRNLLQKAHKVLCFDFPSLPWKHGWELPWTHGKKLFRSFLLVR